MKIAKCVKKKKHKTRITLSFPQHYGPQEETTVQGHQTGQDITGILRLLINSQRLTNQAFRVALPGWRR